MAAQLVDEGEKERGGGEVQNFFLAPRSKGEGGGGARTHAYRPTLDFQLETHGFLTKSLTRPWGSTGRRMDGVNWSTVDIIALDIPHPP